MFTKALFTSLFLLSLSLSAVQAVPVSHNEENCPAAVTVTVTAGAAEHTTAAHTTAASHTTAAVASHSVAAASSSAKSSVASSGIVDIGTGGTKAGTGKTTTGKTTKGKGSGFKGKGGKTNKGTGNKGAQASSAAVSVAASSSTAAASTSTNVAVATGGGNEDAAGAQNSTTLLASQIATGFFQNGQAVQEAGQVASLTSNNNFINFCASTTQPLSNGLQIATGSCNPAIMGSIPATTAMPSSKFAFPTNLATISENTPFTIVMNVANLETGNFVNADENYFAAPQQLNAQGQIIGHSHVVVEAISSLSDTTPTNPQNFFFFKGLNAAAVNGQLTANVTSGLPAGTYRLSSINTAANHQPALVPVAQHGSLDDQVYFSVA